MAEFNACIVTNNGWARIKKSWRGLSTGSPVGRVNVLSFVDINFRHDILMTAWFCRVVRPFCFQFVSRAVHVTILLHLICHTILIRYWIFFCKSVQDLTEKRYKYCSKPICVPSLIFKRKIREFQKCNTLVLSRELQWLELSVIELCKHPEGNGPFTLIVISVKEILWPFIYISVIAFLWRIFGYFLESCLSHPADSNGNI